MTTRPSSSTSTIPVGDAVEHLAEYVLLALERAVRVENAMGPRQMGSEPIREGELVLVEERQARADLDRHGAGRSGPIRCEDVADRAHRSEPARLKPLLVVVGLRESLVGEQRGEVDEAISGLAGGAVGDGAAPGQAALPVLGEHRLRDREIVRPVALEPSGVAGIRQAKPHRDRVTTECRRQSQRDILPSGWLDRRLVDEADQVIEVLVRIR